VEYVEAGKGQPQSNHKDVYKILSGLDDRRRKLVFTPPPKSSRKESGLVPALRSSSGRVITGQSLV